MGLWDRLFEKPKRDRFAGQMMEAMRQAGEQMPIRYDADQFKLLVGENSDECLEVFLRNAYEEYRATPRDLRPLVLERFARISQPVEFPKKFEEARLHLMPRVRDRFYCESWPLRSQVRDLPARKLPYRPIADHLGVGLGYDEPDRIIDLFEENLTDWGTSFDEGLVIACENLRQRSQQRFLTPAPGVHVSPWRDGYDASRLILLDLIRDHEVRGDYVVIAPNRDTLILTGSDDRDGLAVMLALAKEALKQPRPISGIPVRLEQGSWKTFFPEIRYPDLNAFRSLRVQTLAGEYEEQKELLVQVHEKTGEDIFVASCTLVQKKHSEELASYCVWSQGVKSLLPQADKVFFLQGKSPEKSEMVAAGDWEHVREAISHLMKPAGLYPERYLVEQFPSPDQLSAFGREISF